MEEDEKYGEEDRKKELVHVSSRCVETSRCGACYRLQHFVIYFGA